MSVTPSLMGRLAIARHLFQVGIDQSHQGEPLAALAILPWHDAVEIFLQSALDYKQATLPKKADFLEYWRALADKGVTLTRHEQINQFNRARVEIKHRGTLPAHMHVEEFRGNVSGFLEENSLRVFEIEFDDISLSGLVRTESVRSALQAAENSIRGGDHKTALEEATRAFHLTLSEYHSGRLEIGSPHRLSDLVPSPFRFGFSSFGSFEREMGDAMYRIGEAITVVGYNLDFDGYRYLQTYGPLVHNFLNGQMQYDWMDVPTNDTEIVWRCINFATNAALRLENRGRS